MNELWFRPLVWADYRLGVLLTVIIPLILIIWGAAKQIEAIVRLLIIYWRVASLLMITVYLMIASQGTGFITGLIANILIPIGLWFWVDVNDEIRDLPPSFLKLSVTTWRWALTLYCTLGAIMTIPFLSCALESDPSAIATCRVWLEPTWSYQAFFHPKLGSVFLGFLGIVGLVIYGLYLGYFVVIRLGKQGRSALEQ